MDVRRLALLLMMATTASVAAQDDALCRQNCSRSREECAECRRDVAAWTELRSAVAEHTQELAVDPQISLLCRDDNSLSVSWTWKSGAPPDACLLEIQACLTSTACATSQTSGWRYAMETNGTVGNASGLEPASLYRLRVTAILTNISATSDWMETLSAGYEPRTPENMTIEPRVLEGGEVGAVVSWQPAADRTCIYEFYLTNIPSNPRVTSYYFKNTEAMASYETKRVYELSFNSLAYGVRYTVKLRGKSRDASRESPAVVQDFVTASCLQARNFNTSSCKPAHKPAALNVTDMKMADSKLQIRATWKAPLEAETTYYTAELLVDEESTHNLTLAGNATGATFPATRLPTNATYYTVIVTPWSEAGAGPRARGDVELGDDLEPDDESAAYGAATYTMVAVVTVLLTCTLLAGCVMISYHRHVKQLRYDERTRYFKSLDEKPPMLTLPLGAETHLDDHWELPLDRLLLGDVLGQGAFGVVRKGLLQSRSHHEQPLREIAVKMLRDEHSLEERRQFLKEMETLKTVGQHRNIVSIIGCCSHGDRPMLITEYCACGDLQCFLRKEWERISSDSAQRAQPQGRVKYAQLIMDEGSGAEQVLTNEVPPDSTSLVVNQLYCNGSGQDQQLKCMERQLTANDLLSFARQITMGMEYLSSNRVVHRDLAARNVLVAYDHVIKISDFGLSRDVYEQNIYHKKSAGIMPIKWMALESLLHQIYTTQSDVWSFGVLLWEIVTLGGNPYPSTQTNRMFKLLRSGYRMECPYNCTGELYDIMMMCWAAKPNSRPTFSQLRLRFDQMLESSMQDQYLNLDLMIARDSPQTTTSSVDQPSSSSSDSKASGYDALLAAHTYLSDNELEGFTDLDQRKPFLEAPF